VTVATSGLALLQDAVAVMLVGPTPEPVMTACNWEFCPSALSVVTPVTEMFTCEQVATAEPVVVPEEAVTLVVPGARQVSNPPGETVAMIGEADCHLADEVTSVTVPFT
jgi:hypothetical protein